VSDNDYVDVRLPRGTARAVIGRLSPYPLGVDVDLDFLVEALEEALASEATPLDQALLYAIGRVRDHLKQEVARQRDKKTSADPANHYEQGLREGKMQGLRHADALLGAIEEGAGMGAETDVIRLYEAKSESRNPGITIEEEADAGSD